MITYIYLLCCTSLDREVEWSTPMEGIGQRLPQGARNLTPKAKN